MLWIAHLKKTFINNLDASQATLKRTATAAIRVYKLTLTAALFFFLILI